MDSRLWEGFHESFPKKQSYFVNLGFINNGDNVSSIPFDSKSIFITHSLGTLWALKYHSHNMAGLISINGFVNFRNFVDKRNLLAMQKQLQRNPEQQMQDFWDMINFKNDLDQNLNIDKLHEGLEWLINWDMSAKLSDLNIPILSLMGDEDRLLPLPKMEKEWLMADIKIMKNGGHILPLSHSKWCVEKIREFIVEYKLET